MAKMLQKHAEKIRFILVGGLNTGIDFGILFLLVAIGLDKIPANFISTGVAMLVSFQLNKSFTFKSTSGKARTQFFLFLAITMFGMWVIQPVILWAVGLLLAASAIPSGVVLLIAKLLATCASLVWNYILYARIVFKDK